MTDDTTRDEDLGEVLRDLQRLRGFASPFDPEPPAPAEAQEPVEGPELGHRLLRAYGRPREGMLELDRLSPADGDRLWRDVWVSEARMLRWYVNRSPQESLDLLPGSRGIRSRRALRRHLVRLEAEDDGAFGAALAGDHPGVRTLALWREAGLGRVAVQEQIEELMRRFSATSNASPPPLLREWERIRDRAQAIILEHHSRFVVWVVNTAIRDPDARCGYFASGIDGLREAIKRYDARHEARLSTYARIWIRQRIRRVRQRESLPLRRPAGLNARFARLRRAEDEHFARHAGFPAAGDLARISGVPAAEAARVLRAFLPSVDPSDRASGVSATIDDRLVDDLLIDPATLTAYRAFLRLVDEILSGVDRSGSVLLPRSHVPLERGARIAEAFRRRVPYGYPSAESLETLARRFGVSRERVRQLQVKGERRLAERLGRRIRRLREDAPSWPFHDAPRSAPATSSSPTSSSPNASARGGNRA